ncbi:MAG: 2-oxoacid:acceptor oxidoreductase subunit alpha [Gemmatimonadota bacterium]|nr:2-oxoacid:acceptor oxidoreductase subunit alpha [Gemmatimonadota bacterium]MDH4351270.1 2-oxoacid:acceptor oxidoreductase subunit alpha [Gemmatimonadota bacterium]MDH5197749.1 2-oxoacid:acceptor oxidoreductase subunit alpha [Gemmatimonadota bacterium]
MSSPSATRPEREVRDTVVIRFAGDSGDGMQLTGLRFTQETALAGSDLATFPDYPAEIRAPAGTTYGVSAFQIHFGALDITSVGDELDVLVAMNPAALKVSLADLRMGGTVLVDTGSFTDRNLQKAGYAKNPLDDHALAPYQVLKLDVTRHAMDAVDGLGLSQKEALRCRNMWALGLMLWMYGRSRRATVEWIEKKFTATPDVRDANLRALNAGHAFGETAEMPSHVAGYSVAAAELPPGTYRTVSGTEALSWGLLAGLKASGIQRMVLGSYPITPASPLLHNLAGFKEYGVVTFQAEDEIAAVCSAIGASYAGALGVTSSSGPGIALKGEAIGLAIATELPLVIVNAQRAGPSTGLPTKTEQSDLYQALFGRNGDAPLPVVATATPSDSYEVGIEAVRLAVTYMTPVMLLTDGFLANAAEPWLIPDADAVEPFPVRFRTDPEGFQPFMRDERTLARAWAIPGTPGLEHRIGGLERHHGTGNISYDPDNHQYMTDIRLEKLRRIALDIPRQEISIGVESGDVAVVGWGSTWGPIHQAVRILHAEGKQVAHIHLRYLWPLPPNLGDLLRRFKAVLVPEMNTGQLVTVLRSEYLVPAKGVNKVTGKPFKVREIVDAVRAALEK